MISAWWLLAAFWLGGCLGMLLAGLLATSRNSSEFDEDEVATGAKPATSLHQRS